jgi:GTP-binding protein YchF
VGTEKLVPAIVEFYDIAGLVAGASKGEGLGNKFLSHIREVAAIVHVVRLFEDGNITHVANKVDPASDIQTVETELILADLSTLDKQKEPKGNASKEDLYVWSAVQKLKAKLDEGVAARDVELSDDEQKAAKQLSLLTHKPVLYVFNVSEIQLENISGTIAKWLHGHIASDNIAMEQFNNYIPLCAKLESEIVALDDADQQEYLKQYNLEESGLNRLIKKAYEMLGLISFLTAGVKEARAWTITRGMLAPQAAGVIHTDFEKNFIKADVASYEDFVSLGGWNKCRDAGKVTLAGKDYEMKDGDVVEFKIGV